MEGGKGGGAGQIDLDSEALISQDLHWPSVLVESWH